MNQRRPLHLKKTHAGYWAARLHRLSGLLLLLFLPAHFYVLSAAIHNEAAFAAMIRWTDQPDVKLMETLLILVLAVHVTGGVRLLALEFLPWSDLQRLWIALASGLSVAAALLFLTNAF